MQTVSLADAKAQLSKVIDAAMTTHLRTMITRNGRPAVVVIAVEDLEALEETIAVLSDPELMAAIREAELDSTSDLSLEDVEAAVARRRG